MLIGSNYQLKDQYNTAFSFSEKNILKTWFFFKYPNLKYITIKQKTLINSFLIYALILSYYSLIIKQIYQKIN